MPSLLAGREVWMLDAMNIRGALQFPSLGPFCEAVRCWAHALPPGKGPPLVVLAVDHGAAQEAYALSERFVVAFSGDSDADTLIAVAVHALLQAEPEIIRVVTSDQLLRRRCSHALPQSAAEAPLGAKRPRAELGRLAFESSSTFGQLLPCSSMSQAAGLLCNQDNVPTSKRAQRKARRRAENAPRLRTGERTEERVAAAKELHHLVSRKGILDCHASDASAAWVRWFRACAVPLRVVDPPDRTVDAGEWWTRDALQCPVPTSRLHTSMTRTAHGREEPSALRHWCSWPTLALCGALCVLISAAPAVLPLLVRNV